VSEAVLKAVEKRLNEKLKQQVREGLSEVFTKLSCKGVAEQIKKGKDVTGNAEYGIRFCVHNKVGPRVDPETLSFSPQTKRAREIEHKFIELINKSLETGGFSAMSPTLLQDIRKGDRKFERTIIERKKQKK
jgi:hypothetical protein